MESIYSDGEDKNMRELEIAISKATNKPKPSM